MTKISPPRRSTKGQPPKFQDVMNNLDRPEGGAMKPLNFKVSSEFHREFKAHAAIHGMAMVDLLREGFELVKAKRG